MPAFLFRARDASGAVVADQVEAATLAQARYALELRGYGDIEFHTGESEEDIKRSILAGAEADLDDPEDWTAADEIAARERQGALRKVGWAMKQHAPYLLLLLVWNFFSWRGERPFGWADWLGFSLTVLYALFFMLVVTPMLAFDQLLEAAVWRDWKTQRRYIAVLRLLRVVFRVIPESELLWREANALAATGRLPEALERVAPLRDNPDTAKHLYHSRASSLYELAGDFAGQLRCMEEAVAGHAEGTDVYIDLASVRIMRFRDVAGAQAALAKIEDRELTETARGAYLQVRGIVATEAGDHAAAEKDLREAEAILGKVGNALIQEFLANLRAYLALTLIATGRPQEARAQFLAACPLLVAQQSHQLVARVDAALAAVPLKN